MHVVSLKKVMEIFESSRKTVCFVSQRWLDRGIFFEALGESGLDEDLQRYAKLFQELGEKELGKCKFEKNKLKKFTCTLSGAVKFGKLFADFTNTIVKVS